MSREINGLAVLGWDVLSVFGLGKAAFRDAVLTGKSFFVADENRAAPKAAHAIPEFDVQALLGRKGTRNMDRLSGLAVFTTGRALEDCDSRAASDPRDTGLVLGTSTGSLKSIHEFTSDTFRQERPYLVNPGHFPNTVINCAAGQCAIRHKLKGPNVTISGGHASFYSGLKFAPRSFRNRFAKALVIGAVEEVTDLSEAGYARLIADRPAAFRPLTEACAMFVLEGADQVPAREDRATVQAVETGCYYDPPDATEEPNLNQARGLAACIRRCLNRAGIAPDSITDLCSRGPLHPGLDRLERLGVALGLEGKVPRTCLRLEELVGETYSALGALQLAAILERFSLTAAKARYALATTVSANGAVGCMLVRSGRRG